ncbi:MAG: hypothetical protein GVY18_07900 [Bacteroidetes bacterium]|nr:hypothetical protein [Bacteroidota bacterium]
MHVGVALGGGGARGLAHIGVLKALDEADIPVDYIAGTSMGCAVGALYASGYTPAQLEKLALRLDWTALLQDEKDRRRLPMLEKLWDGRYVVSLPIRDGLPRLPAGLWSGERLTDVLTRLLVHVQEIEYFHELPTPIGCVVTDLTSEQAIRLESGSLVDAVRASMAIPGVFKPVRSLDGRVFVDGGVIRNLPAQDVREMGSQLVIGVDLSRSTDEVGEIQSVPQVFNQSVRTPRAPDHAAQRDQADVLIEPDVRARSVLDFSDVAGIIAEGAAAARAQLPDIQAHLDSLRKRGGFLPEGDMLALHSPDGSVDVSPAVPPTSAERVSYSYYVASVEVQGLQRVSQHLVLEQFDRRIPGRFSLQTLQRVVDRLRATELFERVTYQLKRTSGGERHLVLRLTENARHLFRAGVRYDSHTHASILLNATLSSPKDRHKVLLDLEAGPRTVVQVQHLLYLGPYIGVHTRVRFRQKRETQKDMRQRVAEWRLRSLSFSTSVAYSLTDQILCRVGIEHRSHWAMSTVASEEMPLINDHSLRVSGMVWYDTYDRALFPRRGQHLFYRYSGSRRGWASQAGRIEQHFDWRVAVPLQSRLSLLGELQFSTSTVLTSEAESVLRPLLETGAVLGGAHGPLLETGQFVGLAQHEQVGRHMRAIMAGIQYEPARNTFAVLRLNVGNTFDAWTWTLDRESYVVGGGVTLGRVTFLGPAVLTVATSTEHTLLVDVSLGSLF